MAADATFDVGKIEAEMTLDVSPFQTGLDAAKRRALDAQREINAELETELSLDTGDFDRDLAAAKAATTGLSATIPVDLNIAPALASLAVLKAAVDGAGLTAVLGGAGGAGGSGGGGGAVPVPAAGGDAGGGGRGGILGILGGLFAGGAGRGGGGGLGAVGTGLLWGGGGSLLGMGGLAGMGSLGAMAGLGPEHVLMTLLGIAGSAAGATLGGGLLGLGSLGVTGVGMGTDLAGIGQAAGDIKNVVTAQNQLNDAIATYGAASTQAATAQAQLNTTLAGFSPIARSAVLAAANTAQQFHQLFNAATGAAEKTGAQIINQIMQVGEAFLPTIGHYAAENMLIIQSSLQPLFDWLEGPGLDIFNQLEATFTAQLPTAMHAFDQGLQLVVKTIAVASTYTGAFLQTMDRFLTRFNSTAGFDQWASTMSRLIGDFQTWEAFVKALITDIHRLFTADVGTGNSIIQTLTGMLQKLGDWENSVQGRTDLHNMFQTHKQEIQAILALLPPLLSALGSVYMTVAPAMTSALTTVLSALAPLLNALAHDPFGAWALGITLIAAKLGILGPLFGGAGKDAGLLTQAVAGLGTRLAALVFGTEAVTGATTLMRAAMVAASTTGILVVAAGIFELINHFGVLRGLVLAGAAAVGVLTAAFIVLDAVPIVALVVGIATAIAGLVAGIIYLAKNWSQVWADIKRWTMEGVKIVVDAFLSMAGWIIHAAADAFGWVPGIGGKLKEAASHFDEFRKSVDTALSAVNSQLAQAVGQMNLFNAAAMAAASSIRQASIAAAGALPTFTAGGTSSSGGTTRIPVMAAGGYVDTATLALIGESGPELVLPLNDPNRLVSLVRSVSVPGSSLGPSSGGWFGGSSSPSSSSLGVQPLELYVTVQIGNEEFRGVVQAQAQEVVGRSLQRVITLKKQGVTLSPAAQ